MPKKDELPQELTDRIAKEENTADREMIIAPLRKAKDYVVDKIKGMMPDKEPMKKAKGGSALKKVDAMKNPGLSKLPTEVRNKMGYMKKGGSVTMASKRGDGCAVRGKTKAGIK